MCVSACQCHCQAAKNDSLQDDSCFTIVTSLMICQVLFISFEKYYFWFVFISTRLLLLL